MAAGGGSAAAEAADGGWPRWYLFWSGPFGRSQKVERSVVAHGMATFYKKARSEEERGPLAKKFVASSEV